MHRCFTIFVLLALWANAAFGQSAITPLANERWIEVRTAHFDIYSCGQIQEVNKLAGRLEQFCQAYALLAGVKSIASPPTVVTAFPNHESMKPFLPLYDGKPANLAGFFARGSDENLIVLALTYTNSASSGLSVVFHEYAHLLFRHNDLIWPLWLKEGMSEIYSTFEPIGSQAQIGKPIDAHLRALAKEQFMPLRELFSITPESPQYNEGSKQGVFYAESWLLAHYLTSGGNPVLKARFGKFTQLLSEGQRPEQAFTNALGITLATMEKQLHLYFDAGQFPPIVLQLPAGLSAVVHTSSRPVPKAEALCRLGDELFRIHRPDAAETYFKDAQKLTPASPLPDEGLGLLASERGQHSEALGHLGVALQHGSTNFLVWYSHAKEQYRLTADLQGRYKRLDDPAASEIRTDLEKSLVLMPNFAGAQELDGFFEMVQGDNLGAAKQHLEKAVELDPENPVHLFSLAQVQLRERDLEGARNTLKPLLLPNADAKLRQSAEEMLREIERQH